MRHKRLVLELMSVAAATLDLELLDYDFYLFVEARTGQDALVRHMSEGALGVAVAGGQVPDVTGCTASVRSASAPPRLTLEEATGRLDLSSGFIAASLHAVPVVPATTLSVSCAPNAVAA